MSAPTKNRLAFVLAAAAAAAFFLSTVSDARNMAAAGRWEYFVVAWNGGRNANNDELDRLGAAGWEYAGYIPAGDVVILKRQK